MFKLLKIGSVKNVGFALVMIYGLFFLFAFQAEIVSGVKNGITFCVNLLVPSLFIFMVFSQMVLRVSDGRKFTVLLDRIISMLYNLPDGCAVAVLTGLLGGYPVGASNVSFLMSEKRITRSQAESLIYFLVGAGPAFVVNVVGVAFFGSRFLGVLIFISQFLASVLLGVVSTRCFLSADECSVGMCTLKKRVKCKGLCNEFILAVNESTRKLIYMCAFVVLFSALLAVAEKFFSFPLVCNFLSFFRLDRNLISGLLALLVEVTSGCKLAVNYHLPIYFLIFSISWAGISVHMQIFYILKDLKFSKKKFILSRVFHSILSTLFFYFFLIFLEDSSKVSSCFVSPKITNTPGHPVAFSISLITMCICFVAEITERIYFNDETGS